MACYLPPSERDLLVRVFREYLYQKQGFIEFVHQAELRLASEGMTLTRQTVDLPDEDTAIEWPPNPTLDYRLKPRPVQVLVPASPKDKGAFKVGETGNHAKRIWRLAEPRPEGVAHRLNDLAAFKAGKSKGAGMWVAPFACLPGATIELVGLEYKTSEHEFNYLCEALLSGKNAPFKKWKHYYNDVKSGRMFLELPNDASFEVRSWSNKDTLRGGQITVYLYNEIYQLPGLEVYTGQAQNLRAEQGLAYFTSTPDRPWVKVLHQLAHGKNPDWYCVCGNNALVNPLTFSLNAFMEQAPDWETIAAHAPDILPLCVRSGLQPGGLMSREKFLISWLGKMGEFVGKVYAFQEGELQCFPDSHPKLFTRATVERWSEQQRQIAALREAEHVG